MAFWVYILRCADASYYTGHTDDLELRIAQHESGAISTCYTYNRRPLKLVFTQEFFSREEAIVSEQQIKGWSRKKKEAMIQRDWAKVSKLARNHQVPVHGSTGSPRTEDEFRTNQPTTDFANARNASPRSL
ncbi:MAG: GIY-YIG nuclease family protein [Fibrobacterota bacterium]